MKIDTVELENGQNIFVEVLDINLSEKAKEKIIEKVGKKSNSSSFADDVEDISFLDDVKISMELLKHDLNNIATTVKESFKENQPDEFSVEVSFGFAGEFAIPYITSAKSDGGIKVKATWKKSS